MQNIIPFYKSLTFVYESFLIVLLLSAHVTSNGTLIQ